MDFRELTQKYGNSSVSITVGNFDGVHRGHQHLLKHLAESSTTGSVIAITFSPHPLFFLKKVSRNFMLSTNQKKEEKLKSFGVKDVCTLQFDKELQLLSGKEFIEKYLTSFSNIEVIVVGSDFSVGSDKCDAFEILKDACVKKDIKCEKLEKIDFKGEEVSSTHIRDLIRSGNIEEGNTLLGGEFSIVACVERGLGLGHEKLMPTINQQIHSSYIMPLSGVYITKSIIDKQEYNSITNIGTNPTVMESGENTKIETHILDYSGDLYGKAVEVKFLKHIRNERKFNDLESLKEQISLDIIEVRNFFE